MKPSFALNITDSTIGLLHRTARGWLQVGEIKFDTADLAEALGYLRGSALGLSPGGLTTKLVLPNSQIKYLTLDAPGPQDADRRNQIRAGLVGRTPYNVEDLVFDWSSTGDKVQVAVVARETLDEAEAFATEHRFNPVSFVGLPAAGDFKGEPWFGPTKLSATLLEKGEKVDRDAEPVQATARDLPKSHPAAAKPGADASAEVDLSVAKAGTDADRPTRSQRRAAAAAEQARVADSAAIVDPAPVQADLASTTDAPEIARTFAAFPESRDDDADALTTLPDVAPAILNAEAEPAAAAQSFAATSVTDNQAFPEVAANGVISTEPASEKDDLPPAPSAAIMAAFASRRAAEAPNPKRFGDAITDTTSMRAQPMGGSDLADRLAGKSAPPPLSRPKVGDDAPASLAATRADTVTEPAIAASEPAMAKSGNARANSAFVTAPSIPGARKRKSLPPEATVASGAPDARKSLTKPGGTFASSKDRGKPRYLGLILTGLLLLFLALIAAWSSFITGSNEASQTGTAVVSAPQTATPTDQVIAEVPGVNDEMLADAQDPDESDAQNGVASAGDTVDPAADSTATAQAETVAIVPDAATTDTNVSATNEPSGNAPAAAPAPVAIAVTDSPNAAPLNEEQDEIFLTAIDAPPLALDPLALPSPIARSDALPLPQLEPPPFGTVYQFDADGRIRPTPEGVITPEGVRLVAGKPSLLPPPRPEGPIASALPAATAILEPAASGALAKVSPTEAVGAAVPFPSDPALADARPKARPAGTGRAGDGAALADPNATRISSLRPLGRPVAILTAGEAARQSTAAASLTAQAEQAAAIEAAVQVSFQPDPNASRLAVAVSRRPAARPKDMTRAVEAAVAAAVRAPEPQQEEVHVDENSEPEIASAAPSIPTRASVAKQATYVNAINLSKINLIGVYGSKSSPYALIRQANGRYKKVKVGDSIDGGKVAAIGASEVRYQKSGRMISLKMPKT